MWQKVLISALCVLSLSADLCLAKGYYTISGSKVFRANSNYHISVTNHDGVVPAEIQVGIVGDQSSGNAYSNLKTITVDPEATKIVDLDVGPVTAGEFNLTARGLTGFKFENNTQITLNEKSFSVLIQTDKAIYKPGDLVNFRVIILDANLKPFPLNGDLSIFITDAKQNRVKRWKDGQRDVSKGVFTGDLQLSPTTVLGDWNIEVSYLETTSNKKFEVAEYVLPKFQVNIDTPPLTTFKDQTFRIIVRSTYTYGKPVKGEATVTVSPKFYGSYQPFVQSLLTRKVVKLDGKASVEFNIQDELGFKEDYQREITIEAVVEEELTGRKQNTSATMTLYRTKYELEFSTKASKYKPGLPVEATIKVHYHDGTPVTDKNNQVEIFETYKETYEYSATTITPSPARRVSLDSNGMAKITLSIPQNTSVIDVYAKYLDVTGYLGYLQKSESKSNSYITLIVNTVDPEINQEISATVTSTQNMKSITYLVMGRGDIIIAKTVPLNSVTSHTFKFLASFAMVPRAKLVVYYVTEDGEIISESTTLEFRSQFQNFLKIEMSKTKAKPGEDLSLTISTKPNSLVALLGVDQSVNLLKSGNDLNQDNIFQELESYETATQYGGRHPLFKRFSPWYHSNVWKDFDNSGMVLLTNAQEEESQPLVGASPEILYSLASAEYSPLGAHSPDHVSPPKIRKDFPETWIWELINETRLRFK